MVDPPEYGPEGVPRWVRELVQERQREVRAGTCCCRKVGPKGKIKQRKPSQDASVLAAGTDPDKRQAGVDIPII